MRVPPFLLLGSRDSVEYARNEAFETKNHPLCGCATEVIQRNHLSNIIEVFKPKIRKER